MLIESSDHDVDHGDIDKCFAGNFKDFVVFREAAVLAQPGKRPFDDPPLRQQNEPGRRATNDLQRPIASLPSPGDQPSRVSGIGEYDTELTSGTIPTAPVTNTATVILDLAAAAKADVLADLAALDALFAQSLEDAALVLTETEGLIDATRAAAQNSVVVTQAKAVAILETAERDAQNAVSSRIRRARQRDTKILSAKAASKKLVEKSLEKTQAIQNQSHQDHLAQQSERIDVLEGGDDIMSDGATDAQNRVAHRDQIWAKRWKELVNKMARGEVRMGGKDPSGGASYFR